MSPHELDRDDIRRLLALLDERLRARGLPASVYVVGGAAIAVTVEDGRRTLDVDVRVSDAEVLVEARALADAEGLPRTWLNDNAQPWIPPRPEWALAPATEPGLVVHWAPPEHLLAMKLVAMRPQDSPDIIRLARQLGLGVDPAAYVALLEQAYPDEGALQQQLGVPFDDVPGETWHRAEVAARLVAGPENH